MKQQERDNRNAVVSAVLAVVILAVCVAVSLSFDDPPPAESVVILSPAYFECGPCADAKSYLKQTYAGVNVVTLKLSREQTKGLGIKGFPTILVGERLTVGLDRAVVSEEMSR